jgi:hypothetical protein
LEVGLVPGSEIMYVRLHGKRGQDEQLARLVSAVAQAYAEEVIYNSKSSQLRTRDLLAKNLQGLENEIEHDMALYHKST